jgi:carbonic anhydrase
VQPIRASLQPNDDLTQAIQGNARYAAGQLVKRSQVLADAQASGKVKIQPAFFDIQSGRVSAV